MKRGAVQIVVEPVAAAVAAGLRHVTDADPGLRRVRTRKGFRYTDRRGRPIRDRRVLARIRALVIPPAWSDVWICARPDGHIQAIGRDARGRKQYRYHPRWRAVRDETKYNRLLAFADALPRLRARVAADLARPGLPREKVLATVVRLLERTLIRVGNEEYAHANHSFGLTTLRDEHVRVARGAVTFRFRGKGGIMRVVELSDARLARIVKRCRELPGFELFQYVDRSGKPQRIGSADVNAYVREIGGEDFTAKDFRTWAGTVLTALALRQIGASESPTRAKRNVVRAIEASAKLLGNTPTICRKCYVHPAVVDAYLEGETIDAARATNGLGPEEAAVVALLRHRLNADASRARRAS